VQHVHRWLAAPLKSGVNGEAQEAAAAKECPSTEFTDEAELQSFWHPKQTF